MVRGERLLADQKDYFIREVCHRDIIRKAYHRNRNGKEAIWHLKPMKRMLLCFYLI